MRQPRLAVWACKSDCHDTTQGKTTVSNVRRAASRHTGDKIGRHGPQAMLTRQSSGSNLRLSWLAARRRRSQKYFRGSGMPSGPCPSIAGRGSADGTVRRRAFLQGHEFEQKLTGQQFNQCTRLPVCRINPTQKRRLSSQPGCDAPEEFANQEKALSAQIAARGLGED